MYLDTNLYKFIAACGETDAVRGFLDGSGVCVVASGMNLFELFGCRDREERAAGVRALLRVGCEFPSAPETYEVAMEFVREVRRCRPGAMLYRPRDTTIKRHLEQFQETWRLVRSHPDERPHYYWHQHGNMEGVIRRVLGSQRSLRKVLLEHPDARFVVTMGESEIDAALSRMDEVELIWRDALRGQWGNVLKGSVPESRDMRDWIGPYVPRPAVEFERFQQFWYFEVLPSNIPLNKLIALVDHSQKARRPTHGNSADALHAVYLISTDLFVTADKAFHSVLQETARHFDPTARVVLINRAAPSALNELVRTLTKSPTP